MYDFERVWVDLDERKRPKGALKLFDWATAEGWRQGLRPERVEAISINSESKSGEPGRNKNQQSTEADPVDLVRQIEALEKPLGKILYRGLLKSVARVWRPGQVQDMALLRKVLAQCKRRNEAYEG